MHGSPRRACDQRNNADPWRSPNYLPPEGGATQLLKWKSERLGVGRCPADFRLLGEGEPAGTFEAYVAIFGTPDRPDIFGDSEVIEPGAFTQTVQDNGLPPIVWSHVWTIPPVGHALQAVEDAKGLRIKARLFLDDDGFSGQYARSIHTGMTASPPVVREFSFAFEAKEWSDEKAANGQYIRHLKRLERLIGGNGVDDEEGKRLTGEEALAWMDGRGFSLLLGLAQTQAAMGRASAGGAHEHVVEVRLK
ncbi:MAG: hypothetical protein Kow0010_20490 [Dehalococcoidia bacterium]